MKNKKKRNPLLRIFLFVSALLLMTVIAAIGMFYYIFGIPEPEGVSLASWPNRFTENFSVWMEDDHGEIKIEEIGLKRLDEYGLWLQVIDESGREVFSHNKPISRQTSYRASELIALSFHAYEQGNTVFVSSYKSSEKTWSYLIGFPYAVGKHMLYYNGENVGRLFPLFRMGLLLIFCFSFLFMAGYVFWLTRHLGRIAKGIEAISMRSFTFLDQKGVFGEIYGALNLMDAQLCHSDKVKQDTERLRREWIANITHDLKTPLSPIKGYAELLMQDPDQSPDQSSVREYGRIILKNANYTEKMINDLKLTYQLDCGAAPYHPKKVRLVRFLKERVIDIVNDPAFRNRKILFENEMQECEIQLDMDLFRRALDNLIINALTHNPPETEVKIRIGAEAETRVWICISDNGAGMDEEELSELFNRYYRGTSTKEKPEGSGLGLAIAKQIITLHGGEINVKSRPGEGTSFTVELFYKNQ